MLQPDVRSAARAARPEQPRRVHRLLQHDPVVDYFIILRDGEFFDAVGCVGVSGSDFARNFLRELIPLLIPLLFRC